MKTEKELNQIVRVLNNRLDIDGTSKDAFLIDHCNDGYRLEQVNGKTYGIRTTRENLYWQIDAMIEGVKLGKRGE
jgi:hypothetical protein